MILTCPNCYCQFKIGIAVFGREARHVKCTSCGEVWKQDPTLDDYSEEISEELKKNPSQKQDIFETEESEIAQTIEDETTTEDFIQGSKTRVEAFERNEGRRLAQYVGGGIFLIILAYLLLVSSSMMQSHPAMQGFYKFFGIHMKLPDTWSLMFEDVKAERRESSVNVSGRIVNLSSQKWALPMIEITVFRPTADMNQSGLHGTHKGKYEEIIAQWVETPPEPILDVEMETQFSYERHVSIAKVDSGYEKVSNAPDENHAEQGHDANVPVASDDAHSKSVVVNDEGGANTDQNDTHMVRVRFVVWPHPEKESTEVHSEVIHETETTTSLKLSK